MDPEPPRERQYFYNPWLLSLLYSRLLFLEQLLALHTHLHPEPERATELLRHSVRAEAVLGDVAQLLETLAQQQFACEAAHCNFEYALYRLAALARPDGVSFHADCADPGALYACECALGAELGKLPGQSALLFGAVERYIAQHYCGEALARHPEWSARRLALLMNAKATMERRWLALLPGSADTVVCYNPALLMTMLHRVLLEQFSVEVQCRARIGEPGLEAEAQLLERLIAVAQRQYCDEFNGYAVQCYPRLADALELPRELGEQYMQLDNCNRQYALRRNPVPSVRQLEQSEREWLFVDCATGQHRYLRLRQHAHHYLHMARRFVFDCALRRLHGRDCLMAPDAHAQPSTPLTKRASYARRCQICRYLEQESELGLLYAQCEQFHRCSNDGTEPVQPHHFLASLLVRPLGTYNGWLYRCLDELQRLFLASGFTVRSGEYSELRGCESEQRETVNLFQMLDLGRLRAQVQRQLARQKLDDQADAVLAISSGKQRQPSEAQRALALRIVLLQAVQQAVAEQQVEVESYERSLGALATSEKVHLNVCAELARIYLTYRRVLSEWLAV